MSTAAVFKRPTSREVRAFAIRAGLAEPGKGRLSDEAIEAFNKGRRGMHRYVRSENVQTHTVKPAKGRAVTRNYRVPDARAWAVANGLSKAGQRGRMSTKILDAYILSLVQVESEEGIA